MDSGAGIDPDSIQQLYVKHCVACHGADGHGDGPASEYLFPKPRAFRDSQLRFAPTSAAIVRTIGDGVPRSAMPGFAGVLGERQIAGLAKLVAGLTERSTGGTSLSQSSSFVSVPEPPYFTSGLVEYGASLFRSIGCVNCHGQTGHGEGAGAEGLLDSLGKPVRPADLASGLFKSGQRPEDLFRAIVAGVPGTPMPVYGPMLIPDWESGAKDVTRIWALVAYAQSLARARLPGKDSGTEFHVQTADEAMLATPGHVGWVKVTHTPLAVRPLWFRVEETLTLNVSVVRAGDRIGVHVWWDDATCDVNQDSGKFPDGVAVMFAMGDEVPPLPMGVQIEQQPTSAPVNIWHWKASRQFDASSGRRHDADEPRVLPDGSYHLFGPPPEASSPVPIPPSMAADQDLRLTDPLYRTATVAGNIHADPALLSHAALEANAIGFGTLTYQPAEYQDLRSTAVWAHGHWFVTIHRQISANSDDIEFLPGKRIPITVAVWNGSKGDRNGTKLISGWHWLVVDKVDGDAVPAPATPTK